MIKYPVPGRSGLRAILVFFLLASWVTWTASVNPARAQAPAARKPNVILILADDLGYGDLGCYGQEKIKTPHLDKLASEGVRFTDFYAGSTVCAPSRCSLMTGLHTGHARIRGNSQKSALAPEDITVADLLRKTGYFTGLIGKWGLGDEGSSGVPSKQGFDEFAGYLNQTHAHDYYTDYLYRIDPRAGFDGRTPLPANWGGKKGTYVPDLMTKAALSFVEINKPERYNSYRPFFLFLSYTIPHANNEEGQRSGNGMQVPSDSPYSDQPWPQVERNKAAMISRMDDDIGKLMAKIKELKIDQDTVVFFSSDNGPHKEGGVDPNFFHSSGRFRGIKRDLTEGGIRVPLIARWPGKIAPGRVSDQVCAFWDFLPTVAGITQAKVPEKLDGISMLPTLLSQPQTNQHAFLYWEFHERGFQQAIRQGDWKAIRPQAGEALELYNLKTDPGEKENVAQTETKVAGELEQLFKTARTDSAEWPVKHVEPLKR